MFTAAHKKEDCEENLCRIIRDETRKLRDSIVAHLTFDKVQKAETRRHSNGYDEPDYERQLREREGGFNIRDYNEQSHKEPSWRDWMMNILGGLIVVGIGAVIYQLEDLKASMAASLARQEMDERRIDRMEQRIYRGSP